MSKEPRIFILLLNWNGKADTFECLSSLERLNYSNHKIVIIDNASSDDSVSVLQKKYPQIMFLQNEENLGFAEGNNVGIRYALKEGADFVLLLNNDTIVDPDLLTSFVKAARQKPDAGILGAKILRYDQKDTLDHFGGMWNPRTCQFEEKAKNEKDSPCYENIEKVDYVCGCAFFISRKVIEKIGLLEAAFFLLWEETDFCARARKKGFQVYVAGQAKVWHKISASFVGGKPHTHYYWWRNRLFWIERNLPSQEKKDAYRILRKEIVRNYKFSLLKGLQFHLFSPFQSKEWKKKRRIKYLRYKAGCQGIWDYYRKHMGEGPKWLTKKL